EQAAPVSQAQTSLPPSGETANDRLAASPRRAEWAVVRVGQDSVRAWVVYPERRGNAPVVVAIHDNRGMSNWIRGVADQLAADGYVANAPDLRTKLDAPRRPDGESDPEGVREKIREGEQATRDRFMEAEGEWVSMLVRASPKYAIDGLCFGGIRQV